MNPRLRKIALIAHVTCSVGWLGAVAAYTALDVAAVTGEDLATVRGAYIAMDLTVSYVIVPLALAALVTGVVQALGTPWGLFRHYWVLVKLALTVVATLVLQAETRVIDAMAEVAATGADPRALPGTLPHSIGGLVVLLVITILSVVKPPGLTRYGWRRQQEQRRGPRRRAGSAMPDNGPRAPAA
ncbi:DUF2269 domain-containing protein [Nonomuraea basaltis]|uniref:DUF2269 domain-containing protein n=1 Tax=Nonomuraea basaltis TaxID=2495887 RepID=UPI00110C3F7D|nr:DUF2269 domain-containing protein [Nonomuraea basaltis]TMR99829.1 DUF2269 domain-containing protein [Nonomuraea basaltis]